MTGQTRSAALVVSLAVLALTPGRADEPAEPKVSVVATPGGGIQPQAAVASDGAISMVYFKGDPSGGDLFYTHTEPGETAFSEPTRVNSQPGSAIALGTIRGGQIAIGRDDRIHVAWNGSGGARPANPIKGVPMLYARSNPEGTAFEPQRNLMRKTSQLDGGGTLAAGRKGNVCVGWHGRTEAAPEGEKGRRFYVAHSQDDGETFRDEEPALARDTGACACCGTRALADSRGTVHFLYRAAFDNIGRDMTLLTSRDDGAHFEGKTLDPWQLSACPMSSASLTEGASGVTAAWETAGQVFFSRIDPTSLDPSRPVSPPGGGGDRKHPAVAVNAKDETILVWAEGTGWQRGGALAWQVFDPTGRPTRESGRIAKGVPVWGLPAVVTRRDGGFTIIH
jgi:hypothetical protein